MGDRVQEAAAVAAVAKGMEREAAGLPQESRVSELFQFLAGELRGLEGELRK